MLCRHYHTETTMQTSSSYHINHRCPFVHPATSLHSCSLFTLLLCASTYPNQLETLFYISVLLFSFNHTCTTHSCGNGLGRPTPSGKCAWPPFCPLEPPSPTPSGKATSIAGVLWALTGSLSPLKPRWTVCVCISEVKGLQLTKCRSGPLGRVMSMAVSCAVLNTSEALLSCLTSLTEQFMEVSNKHQRFNESYKHPCYLADN